jgi:hypothetical protein
LHQTDERRDHDDNAAGGRLWREGRRERNGWELVAQRFTGSGGQTDEGILLIIENGLNCRKLDRPKRMVAERFLRKRKEKSNKYVNVTLWIFHGQYAIV